MANRNTAQRDRDRASIAANKPPCYLCGEPIDYTLEWPNPWCFTVDHVVPLDSATTPAERRALDVLNNKRAAHWTHNRAKHARLDGGPIIRRSGALTRPGGTPPTPRPSPPFSA